LLEVPPRVFRGLHQQRLIRIIDLLAIHAPRVVESRPSVNGRQRRVGYPATRDERVEPNPLPANVCPVARLTVCRELPTGRRSAPPRSRPV
jgi:hypothetical protein